MVTEVCKTKSKQLYYRKLESIFGKIHKHAVGQSCFYNRELTTFQKKKLPHANLDLQYEPNQLYS